MLNVTILVDVGSPSARVRILIDISEPLRRGIKVAIENSLNGSWIKMRYERLPDFCFCFGIIGHVAKDCNHAFLGNDLSNSTSRTHSYGPWLRFQPPPKGPIQWRNSSINKPKIFKESNPSSSSSNLKIQE